MYKVFLSGCRANPYHVMSCSKYSIIIILSYQTDDKQDSTNEYKTITQMELSSCRHHRSNFIADI